MNRPRSRAHQGLPDNLYRKLDKRTGRTYYSYRDPRSGKFHGLGTDHEAAFKDAKALNAAIYASIRTARIEALTAAKPSTPAMRQVILHHLAQCEKRKLASLTLRGKRHTGNAWLKLLGADTPIGDITVLKLAQALKLYEDRPRMRQALRSAAIDIWKDAMAEGWAQDNLPEKTRADAVEVKRSRLTLEAFLATYEAAAKLDPWIQRSMELALVSCQRREDVYSMEFREAPGSSAWIDGDALCVIQSKTGTKLRIPLAVEINGWRLGDVVRKCRDSVVSRWLVHHQKRRTKSQPGDQVWIDTITKGFARARDLAGVTGEPGKTPPSFHEIRSLAIRLYTERYGADFAQAIAGHKDAETTAIYRDVRGSEWIQIKAS